MNGSDIGIRRHSVLRSVRGKDRDKVQVLIDIRSKDSSKQSDGFQPHQDTVLDGGKLVLETILLGRQNSAQRLLFLILCSWGSKKLCGRPEFA